MSPMMIIILLVACLFFIWLLRFFLKVAMLAISVALVLMALAQASGNTQPDESIDEPTQLEEEYNV